MFSLKSMIRIVFVSVLIFSLTACAGSAAEGTTVASEPTEAAPLATSTSGVINMGLVQFEPGIPSWYMPGTLVPNTSLIFNVNVLKGQQFTIWLNTSSTSTEIPLAVFVVKDAAGQELTTEPVTYWSQVVAEGQVYLIEVRPLAQKETSYSLTIELPDQIIDPVFGNMYQPLDSTLCETLKNEGVNALGTDLGLENNAPFMDVVGGEAGQGCRITTAGYGTQFTSPQEVARTLVESMGLGWTELPTYQADGPTGTATGLSRDMALMLITASWQPDLGVECPSDQPIESCELTDAQKFYTIEVTLAEYRPGFSLDGHWEDAATGFTLDLFQDWKNIYGQHTVVAENGNKIDSLEASITGMIQGQGATVEFKSSFTEGIGTAELTYVDVNTMQWRIITAPEGEYYFPAEATLKR